MPESDEGAGQSEEQAAAERRRLIDLTRAEKGLPERRNLRRLRHLRSWRSGEGGDAAGAPSPAADPPADESD